MINILHKSAITNMATVQNFQVMSDIFNVESILKEFFPQKQWCYC